MGNSGEDYNRRTLTETVVHVVSHLYIRNIRILFIIKWEGGGLRKGGIHFMFSFDSGDKKGYDYPHPLNAL